MHDIAVRVARASGASAAFVSGSRAVGLGNAHSDLDVYVLRRRGRRSRQQMFTAEHRLDVHHLSYSDLERAIERVLGTRLITHGQEAGGTVDHDDVLLVAALQQGRVVLDDWQLRPLRERLLTNPSKVRQSVINQWLLAGVTYLEDWNGLSGSVAMDDLDAALLVARSALIAGAKALLAAADDLHFGQKWTWHQLSNTAPAGVPVAEFRHLSRIDPLASDNDVRFSEPIRFATTCLVVAGTAGWQGALGSPWPFWRLGGGPLRRNERYAIRSFDDGVVLMGPRAHHLCLKPDVALVWALCHGTSLDQVCTAAQEYRHMCDAYRDLDWRRCKSVIGQLCDAGVVTGPPVNSRSSAAHEAVL